MGYRILGLGPGTFAVGLTFFICLLLTLFVSFVKPPLAPLVALSCLALPAVVLGFFAAAPSKYDRQLDNVEVDPMYFVRLFVVIFLCLGALGGVVMRLIIPILAEPMFVAPNRAPNVISRRKLLELRRGSRR